MTIRLSSHFIRSEFACKCGCGFNTVDITLPPLLESVHTYFSYKYKTKVKIVVSSGCRCREYNEKVQKKTNPSYIPYSSKSQHLYGKAVDFNVYIFVKGEWVEIDPSEVQERILEVRPYEGGLGRYNSFTHIDGRTAFKVWDRRIK